MAVWWTIGLLVLLLALVASVWFSEDRTEVPFTFFHRQLQDRNIKSLEIRGQRAYGEFIDPPLAPVRPPAAQPQNQGQTPISRG